VAIVYIATAPGELVAGDDAAAVIATAANSPPLIFDHGKILGDYLRAAPGRGRINPPMSEIPAIRFLRADDGEFDSRPARDQSALPCGRENRRPRAAPRPRGCPMPTGGNPSRRDRTRRRGSQPARRQDRHRVLLQQYRPAPQEGVVPMCRGGAAAHPGCGYRRR
jgi:hypothetical protein